MPSRLAHITSHFFDLPTTLPGGTPAAASVNGRDNAATTPSARPAAELTSSTSFPAGPLHDHHHHASQPHQHPHHTSLDGPRGAATTTAMPRRSPVSGQPVSPASSSIAMSPPLSPASPGSPVAGRWPLFPASPNLASSGAGLRGRTFVAARTRRGYDDVGRPASPSAPHRADSALGESASVMGWAGDGRSWVAGAGASGRPATGPSARAGTPWLTADTGAIGPYSPTSRAAPSPRRGGRRLESGSDGTPATARASGQHGRVTGDSRGSPSGVSPFSDPSATLLTEADGDMLVPALMHFVEDEEALQHIAGLLSRRRLRDVLAAVATRETSDGAAGVDECGCCGSATAASRSSRAVVLQHNLVLHAWQGKSLSALAGGCCGHDHHHHHYHDVYEHYPQSLRSPRSGEYASAAAAAPPPRPGASAAGDVTASGVASPLLSGSMSGSVVASPTAGPSPSLYLATLHDGVDPTASLRSDASHSGGPDAPAAAIHGGGDDGQVTRQPSQQRPRQLSLEKVAASSEKPEEAATESAAEPAGAAAAAAAAASCGAAAEPVDLESLRLALRHSIFANYRTLPVRCAQRSYEQLPARYRAGLDAISAEVLGQQRGMESGNVSSSSGGGGTGRRGGSGGVESAEAAPGSGTPVAAGAATSSPDGATADHAPHDAVTFLGMSYRGYGSPTSSQQTVAAAAAATSPAASAMGVPGWLTGGGSDGGSTRLDAATAAALPLPPSRAMEEQWAAEGASSGRGGAEGAGSGASGPAASPLPSSSPNSAATAASGNVYGAAGAASALSPGASLLLHVQHTIQAFIQRGEREVALHFVMATAPYRFHGMSDSDRVLAFFNQIRVFLPSPRFNVVMLAMEAWRSLYRPSVGAGAADCTHMTQELLSLMETYLCHGRTYAEYVSGLLMLRAVLELAMENSSSSSFGNRTAAVLLQHRALLRDRLPTFLLAVWLILMERYTIDDTTRPPRRVLRDLAANAMQDLFTVALELRVTLPVQNVVANAVNVFFAGPQRLAPLLGQCSEPPGAEASLGSITAVLESHHSSAGGNEHDGDAFRVALPTVMVPATAAHSHRDSTANSTAGGTLPFSIQSADAVTGPAVVRSPSPLQPGASSLALASQEPTTTAAAPQAATSVSTTASAARTAAAALSASPTPQDPQSTSATDTRSYTALTKSVWRSVKRAARRLVHSTSQAPATSDGSTATPSVATAATHRPPPATGAGAQGVCTSGAAGLLQPAPLGGLGRASSVRHVGAAGQPFPPLLIEIPDELFPESTDADTPRRAEAPGRRGAGAVRAATSLNRAAAAGWSGGSGSWMAQGSPTSPQLFLRGPVAAGAHPGGRRSLLPPSASPLPFPSTSAPFSSPLRRRPQRHRRASAAGSTCVSPSAMAGGDDGVPFPADSLWDGISLEGAAVTREALWTLPLATALPAAGRPTTLEATAAAATLALGAFLCAWRIAGLRCAMCEDVAGTSLATAAMMGAAPAAEGTVELPLLTQESLLAASAIASHATEAEGDTGGAHPRPPKRNSETMTFLSTQGRGSGDAGLLAGELHQSQSLLSTTTVALGGGAGAGAAAPPPASAQAHRTRLLSSTAAVADMDPEWRSVEGAAANAYVPPVALLDSPNAAVPVATPHLVAASAALLSVSPLLGPRPETALPPPSSSNSQGGSVIDAVLHARAGRVADGSGTASRSAATPLDAVMLPSATNSGMSRNGTPVDLAAAAATRGAEWSAKRSPPPPPLTVESVADSGSHERPGAAPPAGVAGVASATAAAVAGEAATLSLSFFLPTWAAARVVARCVRPQWDDSRVASTELSATTMEATPAVVAAAASASLDASATPPAATQPARRSLVVNRETEVLLASVVPILSQYYVDALSPSDLTAATQGLVNRAIQSIKTLAQGLREVSDAVARDGSGGGDGIHSSAVQASGPAVTSLFSPWQTEDSALVDGTELLNAALFIATVARRSPALFESMVRQKLYPLLHHALLLPSPLADEPHLWLFAPYSSAAVAAHFNVGARAATLRPQLPTPSAPLLVSPATATALQGEALIMSMRLIATRTMYQRLVMPLLALLAHNMPDTACAQRCYPLVERLTQMGLRRPFSMSSVSTVAHVCAVYPPLSRLSQSELVRSMAVALATLDDAVSDGDDDSEDAAEGWDGAPPQRSTRRGPRRNATGGAGHRAGAGPRSTCPTTTTTTPPTPALSRHPTPTTATPPTSSTTLHHPTWQSSLSLRAFYPCTPEHCRRLHFPAASLRSARRRRAVQNRLVKHLCFRAMSLFYSDWEGTTLFFLEVCLPYLRHPDAQLRLECVQCCMRWLLSDCWHSTEQALLLSHRAFGSPVSPPHATADGGGGGGGGGASLSRPRPSPLSPSAASMSAARWTVAAAVTRAPVRDVRTSARCSSDGKAAPQCRSVFGIAALHGGGLGNTASAASATTATTNAGVAAFSTGPLAQDGVARCSVCDGDYAATARAAAAAAAAVAAATAGGNADATKHHGRTHVNALREVVHHLVELAVCDPEPLIRQRALESLTPDTYSMLYPHDAVVHQLFVVLWDSHMPNRTRAAELLCALAPMNPSCIFPRLRQALDVYTEDMTGSRSRGTWATTLAITAAPPLRAPRVSVVHEDALLVLSHIATKLKQSTPLYLPQLLSIISAVLCNSSSSRQSVLRAMNFLVALREDSTEEHTALFTPFIDLVARQLVEGDGDMARQLAAVAALQSLLQQSADPAPCSPQTLPMVVGRLHSLLYRKPSVGTEFAMAVLQLLGTISSIEPWDADATPRAPALLRRPPNRYALPPLSALAGVLGRDRAARLRWLDRDELADSASLAMAQLQKADRFAPFTARSWCDTVLRALMRSASGYMSGTMSLTHGGLCACLAAMMNVLTNTIAVHHLELYLPTVLTLVIDLLERPHTRAHPGGGGGGGSGAGTGSRGGGGGLGDGGAVKGAEALRSLFLRRLFDLILVAGRRIGPMYPLLNVFLRRCWKTMSLRGLVQCCEVLDALCWAVPDLLRDDCDVWSSSLVEALVRYDALVLTHRRAHEGRARGRSGGGVDAGLGGAAEDHDAARSTAAAAALDTAMSSSAILGDGGGHPSTEAATAAAAGTAAAATAASLDSPSLRTTMASPGSAAGPGSPSTATTGVAAVAFEEHEDISWAEQLKLVYQALTLCLTSMQPLVSPLWRRLVALTLSECLKSSHVPCRHAVHRHGGGAGAAHGSGLAAGEGERSSPPLGSIRPMGPATTAAASAAATHVFDLMADPHEELISFLNACLCTPLVEYIVHSSVNSISMKLVKNLLARLESLSAVHEEALRRVWAARCSRSMSLYSQDGENGCHAPWQADAADGSVRSLSASARAALEVHLREVRELQQRQQHLGRGWQRGEEGGGSGGAATPMTTFDGAVSNNAPGDMGGGGATGGGGAAASGPGAAPRSASEAAWFCNGVLSRLWVQSADTSVTVRRFFPFDAVQTSWETEGELHLLGCLLVAAAWRHPRSTPAFASTLHTYFVQRFGPDSLAVAYVRCVCSRYYDLRVPLVLAHDEEELALNWVVQQQQQQQPPPHPSRRASPPPPPPPTAAQPRSQQPLPRPESGVPAGSNSDAGTESGASATAGTQPAMAATVVGRPRQLDTLATGMPTREGSADVIMRRLGSPLVLAAAAAAATVAGGTSSSGTVTGAESSGMGSRVVSWEGDAAAALPVGAECASAGSSSTALAGFGGASWARGSPRWASGGGSSNNAATTSTSVSPGMSSNTCSPAEVGAVSGGPSGGAVPPSAHRARVGDTPFRRPFGKLPSSERLDSGSAPAGGGWRSTDTHAPARFTDHEGEMEGAEPAWRGSGGLMHRTRSANRLHQQHQQFQAVPLAGNALHASFAVSAAAVLAAPTPPSTATASPPNTRDSTPATATLPIPVAAGSAGTGSAAQALVAGTTGGSFDTYVSASVPVPVSGLGSGSGSGSSIHLGSFFASTGTVEGPGFGVAGGRRSTVLHGSPSRLRVGGPAASATAATSEGAAVALLHPSAAGEHHLLNPQPDRSSAALTAYAVDSSASSSNVAPGRRGSPPPPLPATATAALPTTGGGFSVGSFTAASLGHRRGLLARGGSGSGESSTSAVSPAAALAPATTVAGVHAAGGMPPRWRLASIAAAAGTVASSDDMASSTATAAPEPTTAGAAAAAAARRRLSPLVTHPPPLPHSSGASTTAGGGSSEDLYGLQAALSVPSLRGGGGRQPPSPLITAEGAPRAAARGPGRQATPPQFSAAQPTPATPPTSAALPAVVTEMMAACTAAAAVHEAGGVPANNSLLTYFELHRFLADHGWRSWWEQFCLFLLQCSQDYCVQACEPFARQHHIAFSYSELLPLALLSTLPSCTVAELVAWLRALRNFYAFHADPRAPVPQQVASGVARMAHELRLNRHAFFPPEVVTRVVDVWLPDGVVADLANRSLHPPLRILYLEQDLIRAFSWGRAALLLAASEDVATAPVRKLFAHDPRFLRWLHEVAAAATQVRAGAAVDGRQAPCGHPALAAGGAGATTTAIASSPEAVLPPSALELLGFHGAAAAAYVRAYMEQLPNNRGARGRGGSCTAASPSRDGAGAGGADAAQTTGLIHGAMRCDLGTYDFEAVLQLWETVKANARGGNGVSVRGGSRSSPAGCGDASTAAAAGLSPQTARYAVLAAQALSRWDYVHEAAWYAFGGNSGRAAHAAGCTAAPPLPSTPFMQPPMSSHTADAAGVQGATSLVPGAADHTSDSLLQRQAEVFVGAAFIATHEYDSARRALAAVRAGLRDSYAVFHTDNDRAKLEWSSIFQQLSDLEEGMHALEQMTSSHEEAAASLPPASTVSEGTSTSVGWSSFASPAVADREINGKVVSEATVRRLRNIACRPVSTSTTLLQRFMIISARSAIAPLSWQLDNILALGESLEKAGQPMRAVQVLHRYACAPAVVTAVTPAAAEYRQQLTLELLRRLIRNLSQEAALREVYTCVQTVLRNELWLTRRAATRWMASAVSPTSPATTSSFTGVPTGSLVSPLREQCAMLDAAPPQGTALTTQELGPAMSSYHVELLLLNVACRRRLAHVLRHHMPSAHRYTGSETSTSSAAALAAPATASTMTSAGLDGTPSLTVSGPTRPTHGLVLPVGTTPAPDAASAERDRPAGRRASVGPDGKTPTCSPPAPSLDRTRGSTTAPAPSAAASFRSAATSPVWQRGSEQGAAATGTAADAAAAPAVLESGNHSLENLTGESAMFTEYYLLEHAVSVTHYVPSVWREFGLVLFDVCMAIHAEWQTTGDAETKSNFLTQSAKAIHGLQLAAQLWRSRSTSAFSRGIGPYPATMLRRHGHARTALPSAHLLLKALHLAVTCEAIVLADAQAAAATAAPFSGSTRSLSAASPPSSAPCTASGVGASAEASGAAAGVRGDSVSSSTAPRSLSASQRTEQPREEAEAAAAARSSSAPRVAAAAAQLGGFACLDFSDAAYEQWAAIAPLLLAAAAQHYSLYAAVREMCVRSHTMLRQLVFALIAYFEHGYVTPLTPQLGERGALSVSGSTQLGALRSLRRPYSDGALDEGLGTGSGTNSRALAGALSTTSLSNLGDEDPDMAHSEVAATRDGGDAQGQSLITQRAAAAGRRQTPEAAAPGTVSEGSSGAGTPLGGTWAAAAVPAVSALPPRRDAPTVRSPGNAVLAAGGGDGDGADRGDVRASLLREIAAASPAHRRLIGEAMQLRSFVRRLWKDAAATPLGSPRAGQPPRASADALGASAAMRGPGSASSPLGTLDGGGNSGRSVAAAEAVQASASGAAGDAGAEAERLLPTSGSVAVTYAEGMQGEMELTLDGHCSLPAPLWLLPSVFGAAAQASASSSGSAAAGEDGGNGGRRPRNGDEHGTVDGLRSTTDAYDTGRGYGHGGRHHHSTPTSPSAAGPSTRGTGASRHSRRLASGDYAGGAGASARGLPLAGMSGPAAGAEAAHRAVHHTPATVPAIVLARRYSVPHPATHCEREEVVFVTLSDGVVCRFRHASFTAAPSSLASALTSASAVAAAGSAPPIRLPSFPGTAGGGGAAVAAGSREAGSSRTAAAAATTGTTAGRYVMPYALMEQTMTLLLSQLPLTHMQRPFVLPLALQDFMVLLPDHEGGSYLLGTAAAAAVRTDDPQGWHHAAALRMDGSSGSASTAALRLSAKLLAPSSYATRTPSSLHHLMDDYGVHLRVQEMAQAAHDAVAAYPAVDLEAMEIAAETGRRPGVAADSTFPFNWAYGYPASAAPSEEAAAARMSTPKYRHLVQRRRVQEERYDLLVAAAFDEGKVAPLVALLQSLLAARPSATPPLSGAAAGGAASAPSSFFCADDIFAQQQRLYASAATLPRTEAHLRAVLAAMEATAAAVPAPAAAPDVSLAAQRAASPPPLPTVVGVGAAKRTPARRPSPSAPAAVVVYDALACRRALQQLESGRFRLALHEAFSADSANASHWVDARRRYATELSEWSVMQYLFDIHNRENTTVLVNPADGHVAVHALGRFSLQPAPHGAHAAAASTSLPTAGATPLLASPFPTRDPSLFRLSPVLVSGLPIQSPHAVFQFHASSVLYEMFQYVRDLTGISTYGVDSVVAFAYQPALATSTAVAASSSSRSSTAGTPLSAWPSTSSSGVALGGAGEGAALLQSRRGTHRPDGAAPAHADGVSGATSTHAATSSVRVSPATAADIGDGSANASMGAGGPLCVAPGTPLSERRHRRMPPPLGLLVSPLAITPANAAELSPTSGGSTMRGPGPDGGSSSESTLRPSASAGAHADADAANPDVAAASSVSSVPPPPPPPQLPPPPRCFDASSLRLKMSYDALLVLHEEQDREAQATMLRLLHRERESTLAQWMRHVPWTASREGDDETPAVVEGAAGSNLQSPAPAARRLATVDDAAESEAEHSTTGYDDGEAPLMSAFSFVARMIAAATDELNLIGVDEVCPHKWCRWAPHW